MFDVTASTAALLPAARPRYFMGIGDPEGILRVIGAGVDMFDCVLPDPARSHRIGDDLGGAAQSPQRALRARRRPAAGGLPVPGLHALLACVHPPPDHAGRAARPAAADAAQRLVPGRAVPRGAPTRSSRGASRPSPPRRSSGSARARRRRRSARRGPRSEGRPDHARLDRGPRGADVVPLRAAAAAPWRPASDRCSARSRAAIRSSRSAASTARSWRSTATRCGSRSRPTSIVRVARRAVAGRVGVPPPAAAEEPEGDAWH